MSINIEFSQDELRSIICAIEGYSAKLKMTAIKDGNPKRFDTTTKKLCEISSRMYQALISAET